MSMVLSIIPTPSLADAEAFMKSVKVNGGKADNALATVKDPAEKVKIGNNSEKRLKT